MPMINRFSSQAAYFCLVGGSSDLLLVQASTWGDLSGSMWSQSRHFITGGGLPSGPRSKSMGLPQPGQGLRSASVMRRSPRLFRPHARRDTQSTRLICVPNDPLDRIPAQNLSTFEGLGRRTGTTSLPDTAALILEFPQQSSDVLSVKGLCLSQRVEKPSGIHRVVAAAVHLRDQRLLSRNVLVAPRYMSFGLSQIPQ